MKKTNNVQEVWLDAVEACVAQCMAKAEVAAGQGQGALCISSLYGGSGIQVDAQMTPA
ncbi:hypothetical protein [Pseudomonas sp. H2_E05]